MPMKCWKNQGFSILGRILEKIPDSESGSGRVGVLKYTIGYFRVYFLLLGTSGYYWVFPGISDYFWVHHYFWRSWVKYLVFLAFMEGTFWRSCQPLPKIIMVKYLKNPNMSGNTKYWVMPEIWVYLKHWVIPNISGYPLPDYFQNWIGSRNNG